MSHLERQNAEHHTLFNKIECQKSNSSHVNVHSVVERKYKSKSISSTVFKDNVRLLNKEDLK